MAASSRHMCRAFLNIPRRITKRKRFQICPFQQPHTPNRTFTTTFLRAAEDQIATGEPQSQRRGRVPERSREIELKDIDTSELLTPSNPISAVDFDPEERATYEALSKPEQVNYLALRNHTNAILESPRTEEQLERLAEEVGREIDREDPWDFPEEPKVKASELGYWGDDEDDEFGQVEDADDEVYDEHITTVAENELDLHREIREYTRIAAWDMPLLSKFAKEAATISHTSTPLRFRHTTYMGESHPAARKIVLSFVPQNLPITPSQQLKLQKLFGPRYDPETGIARMSCEQFPEAAQNKRYLGDLVNRLVEECKAEGEGVDGFEDVPLDTRHWDARVKRRGLRVGRRGGKGVVSATPPEEWNLTPERVRELMKIRGVVRVDGEAVEGGNTEEGKAGEGGSGGPGVVREERVPEYVRADNAPPDGRSRILDFDSLR